MIALEILLYSTLILLSLATVSGAFVFVAKLMVDSQKESDSL
jgi:hypothetical protein